MTKISVVINTLNEEANLPNAVKSIRDLADEIIVVDMHSSDNTVEIAKKNGAKVYQFAKVGYVEPARNFAIEKATGDWVLILDADEEVPEKLSFTLKTLSQEEGVDHYTVPRQNIIFGKWIKHSKWWPDYNIRFFRRKKVRWSSKIHQPPLTYGVGKDLPAKKSYAIIHHNYQSIDQYITRLNRYTSIQANALASDGYKFIWTDLIQKPTQEFLSRFFAAQGFKDGLHGLVLAILQAISEFVTYLKVWQSEQFANQQISINEINIQLNKSHNQLKWWSDEVRTKDLPFFIKIPTIIKRKIFYK